MLLVGRQEGHPACRKTEWWGAVVVICLERVADLHMAQLMPLPLTVSCFSKIQISLTFLVLAHLGSPRKRAVKWVCVCVLSALRSQNWRMAAHEYVMNSWKYGVIFIFHDWILCLVPLYSGSLGNYPQILRQIWRCRLRQVVITKWLNMKTGKYSFKRGILVKSVRVSLYPFLRSCSGCVGSNHYRLLWTLEYHPVAAL